jgi:acyl carrier protein
MARDRKDREKVFGTIKGILIKKCGIEPDEIVEKADLMWDLGLDSLDAIELILSVEEKFDISIPDERAELLTTIGTLTDYVVNGKLPDQPDDGTARPSGVRRPAGMSRFPLFS